MQHLVFHLEELLILRVAEEEVLVRWTALEDVVVLAGDLRADQVLEALLVHLDEQVISLGVLPQHAPIRFDLVQWRIALEDVIYSALLKALQRLVGDPWHVDIGHLVGEAAILGARILDETISLCVLKLVLDLCPL